MSRSWRASVFRPDRAAVSLCTNFMSIATTTTATKLNSSLPRAHETLYTSGDGANICQNIMCISSIYTRPLYFHLTNTFECELIRVTSTLGLFNFSSLSLAFSLLLRIFFFYFDIFNSLPTVIHFL